MESESPEKSQLRFSEKRGLLVYEGEFSPDFPLGEVEPSHFAPPAGEVTLGSLTPCQARGKEPFETARTTPGTLSVDGHTHGSYRVASGRIIGATLEDGRFGCGDNSRF